jgi:hypothetical protein
MQLVGRNDRKCYGDTESFGGNSSRSTGVDIVKPSGWTGVNVETSLMPTRENVENSYDVVIRIPKNL